MTPSPRLKQAIDDLCWVVKITKQNPRKVGTSFFKALYFTVTEMNRPTETVTFSFNNIELGLAYSFSVIGTLVVLFYFAASITLIAMGEYSTTTSSLPKDIQYSSLILALPAGIYIANRVWENAFKNGV